MWYKNATTFRTFLNVLLDANYFDTLEEVGDFVKTPENFDEMYDAWSEAGAPEEGEDGFDEYCETLFDDTEEEEVTAE